MGRGKREESSRLFPLPIVPRAPSIFRLLLFFFLLEYPVEASVHVEERGKNLGLRTFW